MMANSKKITVYLFSAILAVSLIAGYFCFMPRMAQATSVPTVMPGMSFSDCQEMVVVNHYMLSSSAPTHAIAPCCLEKSERSRSDAINLNNFSFGDTGSQSISTVQITNNDSANRAVLFDYPISPTQTELLSSVIIRD